MTHPPLLIESWLPIAALGAESQRERGASSALPPLYFLHVWWARRPLIASRAAILASVLPAWSAQWPAALRSRFPDEETYHQWFLRFIGIRGDPAKGRKLIQWAKARDVQLQSHPYEGAPRAFTVNPAAEDLAIMGDLLEFTWGRRDLSVLDPFAGGGSIPFEALRYGFNTIANDLNPVAAVILKATLDYPARFGSELAGDIRKWGDAWAARVKEKLAPYFPKQPGESIFAYLWARTVACPVTGKPAPLSPNWWLRGGDDPVAVRLIAEPHMAAPRFEIYRPTDALHAANPDNGTLTRGIGRSPWTGETIPKEHIKSQAQSGSMTDTLFAVVLKTRTGFEFAPPDQQSMAAITSASSVLQHKWPQWTVNDMALTEAIPYGHRSHERDVVVQYGITEWRHFFSDRQLLSLTTYLEELQNLRSDLEADLGSERAAAVYTYLALALDKAVIYNNRHCRFDPSRGIRSIFDRHDFAFIWSYAEFDAAANLLPWVLGQTEDAYRQVSALHAPARTLMAPGADRPSVERLSISLGSATDLPGLADASIANITVDPPYYNNVDYAELSDFFYVWLKRSAGRLFPDFFRDELTNKDDEAVANPARFHGMTQSAARKEELAKADYERKMAAAFREMGRVLRDDGSLTVMFTHKQVAAWDTLASALIGAGFTVKASWPVHTESEHSLHQAQKNAAASTILLVCRKREGAGGEGDKVTRGMAGGVAPGPVWWDDLQPRVRETARQKAAEFAAQGIGGVDLYISVFGPTLSIISEQWPVLTSEVDPRTGQPRTLRPETALDLAREEVVRLRKEGLLSGREVQFDANTDWYLMAWDAFAAEQFPYDEARKLAIALGVDLDKTIMAGKRLAAKKGEFIVLQTPVQRRRKGVVDDEVLLFESWVDAAHTAMMVWAEDGAGACDVFLRKTGFKTNTTFRALLQALLNAVPRTRVKGRFVRPEAEALENLRLAFFDDLVAPVEEEPRAPEYLQLGMQLGAEEGEDLRLTDGFTAAEDG